MSILIIYVVLSPLIVYVLVIGYDNKLTKNLSGVYTNY